MSPSITNPPSLPRTRAASSGDNFQRRLKDREAPAKIQSQPVRSGSASDSSLDSSGKSSMDWQVGAEKRAYIDSEHDADDGYSVSSYSSYHDLKGDREGGKGRSPRTPLPPPSNRRRWMRRILVSAALAGLVILSYRAMSTLHSNASKLPETTIRPTSREAREPYFAKLYKSNSAGPGVWPVSVQRSQPTDFCSICNCHATPAFYGPSVEYADKFPPRPRKADIYTSADSIDRNEFMRQTILDIYCARQHLDAQQAFKLARRTAGHLDEMAAWSIESLELGKPTVYLTTATSPNGKADILRPQYFRRHGRAVRTWMKKQEEQAKTAHPDWQVVWIIAEDEVDIDPLVIQTLKRTGVPYIYFAYGLTKAWGNAQKNAVLQVAHALSQPREFGGLFGHGPVYGLDDDNKILPEILDLLVKVSRIGVFPVGNLGLSGFEGAILNDMGEIIESESLWQFRKYAFDYGGFTFNSSLLGTVISGPMFWKHTEFAGESEFFDQIVNGIREVEPLCGKQKEQDCHVVWHNEPLVEIETMTDDEEIEYVQQHGVEKLFEVLEVQVHDAEARKADEYELPLGDWEDDEEVYTEVVEVEVEVEDDGTGNDVEDGDEDNGEDGMTYGDDPQTVIDDNDDDDEEKELAAYHQQTALDAEQAEQVDLAAAAAEEDDDFNEAESEIYGNEMARVVTKGKGKAKGLSTGLGTGLGQAQAQAQAQADSHLLFSTP